METTGRFTYKLRKLAHYSHDKCARCGSALPYGKAAYAGYTQDGTEAYVGECCLDQLVEVASHMYWWWTSYKRPEVATPLFRYMEFGKFVSLLKDKALWFARLDRLGDPFEGARGVASRRHHWKAHSIQYLVSAIITAPRKDPKPIGRDEVLAEAERLYEQVEEAMAKEIGETFASCWHSNKSESEALWRLYCPPPTTGVAIQTDFGSLDRALSDVFDIKFGHVQYIDYQTSFAGTYDRPFFKRNSLSHEMEVRGVVRLDYAGPEMLGLLVPVEINAFIKQVIVSPFAPPWFEPVLKETMEKFGVSAPVSQSALADQPFI